MVPHGTMYTPVDKITGQTDPQPRTAFSALAPEYVS